jgi:hypothetical protein
VGGKADWLANGLPREGANATVPYAGELADRDPPTCALGTPVADVRAALAGSRYGFCLVVDERRVVLGRVRRSAITDAAPAATAEAAMVSGPSAVRFSVPAAGLAHRLATRDLKIAVVTTPGGCLVGVFYGADAGRRLDRPEGRLGRRLPQRSEH